MTLPRRPWLRADAPLLWRAEGVIEVGDGPRRTVLGVAAAEVAWAASLRGDRPLAAVLQAAQAVGITASRATSLLMLLDRAGALDDAGHVPDAIRSAEPADRDTLAGVMGAARHVHGGAQRAAELLDHRHEAAVAVHGTGLAAEAVADGLTAAGIGMVLRSGPGGRRCDRVLACQVLASEGHPDIADDHGALALDLPHLPVTVHAGRAEIGPLVVPGRTACLTCADLHRRDADPDWPRVAVQLAHRRPPGSAVDPVLARLAGSLAALQVAAWVDAGGPDLGPEDDLPVDDAPTLGAVLRVTLPGARQEVLPRVAHPLCGCRWPLGAKPTRAAS